MQEIRTITSSGRKIETVTINGKEYSAEKFLAIYNGGIKYLNEINAYLEANTYYKIISEFCKGSDINLATKSNESLAFIGYHFIQDCYGNQLRNTRKAGLEDALTRAFSERGEVDDNGKPILYWK